MKFWDFALKRALSLIWEKDSVDSSGLKKPLDSCLFLHYIIIIITIATINNIIIIVIIDVIIIISVIIL